MQKFVSWAGAWLTPRRLRAQCIVLALCLWGTCAVDFSTPGLFDRAGNIKFQDFLPFYISARLISQHRAADLYDPKTQAAELHSIVSNPGTVQVPYLYGPQVGLVFLPFANLIFHDAARIWAVLSLLLYAACIYMVRACCPNLRPYSGTVFLAAIAFPPLFHFYVRGQISALVLACFTAAFLALRADQLWMAGVALGFLIFKPQFLVAIPFVLLLARSWKILSGIFLSAGAQILFASLYFGPSVMSAYFDMLRHSSRWIGAAELSGAPIQMHSLRAFWALLIPQPTAGLALYILSSIAVLALATSIWRSDLPIALRFSALTLAAVLVNPHLFVYDLLALVPALLLLADWVASNCAIASTPHASRTLLVLTYLAFVLPLFGPLSRWTHVQFSVIVFTAIVWTLFRLSRDANAAADCPSFTTGQFPNEPRRTLLRTE
jgi:alpha-1,2-mannosyltransferase